MGSSRKFSQLPPLADACNRSKFHVSNAWARVRNCENTEPNDGHTIIVAHRVNSAAENQWWLVSVSSMHGAWQQEQRFSFSNRTTTTISESDSLGDSDSGSLSESDASDEPDLACSDPLAFFVAKNVHRYQL